jgi:hypothetical protein
LGVVEGPGVGVVVRERVVDRFAVEPAGKLLRLSNIVVVFLTQPPILRVVAELPQQQLVG